MAENPTLAFLQQALSQGASASVEEAALVNEFMRRLIISDMTIDTSGNITAPFVQSNPNVSTATGTLPIAHGGTNSTTALSGSSIMVSDGTHINQGAAGTTTTVLHGNAAGAPSYGAVVLTTDVSGLLPQVNGGVGKDTSAATDGQLLIGKTSDHSLNLATLTAGTGVTVTNAGGAITLNATAINGIVQGRLTLTTVTPVTSSDVTAATTLFFTPYKGKYIALFDGSSTWTLIAFSELSINVPATTATMYDVFVFNNSGTATLELLAWTNDTTRATALVLQDGVYVKSGVTTRRYVGSFRTTGVSGQTEDSKLNRMVWNYYNRVRRPLLRLETTASWTYNGAFRQANNSASNQLTAVIGLQEIPIDLTAMSTAQSPVGGRVSVGISDAATTVSTTIDASCLGGASGDTDTTDPLLSTVVARLVKDSPIGYRVYGWLEASTAATTTWYGTPATPSGTAGTANGISGSIDG